MAIMTREEFRKLAGLGNWTPEGKKIKAVQTALNKYHDWGHSDSVDVEYCRLHSIPHALAATGQEYGDNCDLD